VLLTLFASTAMAMEIKPCGDNPPLAAEERAAIMIKASGSFDVKMTPMAEESEVGDASVGRMNLQKTFYGDLTAVGKGQMLAMMTAVEGSAGYVAIERVQGILHGRSGSFALQHSGTMTRGAPSLSIHIVPDSGTEQLAGISGHLLIEITGGKHFYTLEYSLPSTP
jgi:hypothetical protein